MSGVLLYHTHEQYGLADATNLDALAGGADGMWCGLSKEGAPIGNAPAQLWYWQILLALGTNT